MESNGKIVVFIRTSSTARVPVYKHLQEQGYSLVMIHPGESFDFVPMFDVWIDCETNDVEVVEIALRATMKARNFTPDCIVSFDEYGVYPAAQLCERFRFRPLPLSPEGLRNTTIKSAFRDWCGKLDGMGNPKFAKLMGPGDDVEVAMRGISFPCVVKPSPGAGSMLTTRISSLQELRNLLPDLWKTLRGHPALMHLEALGTKIHLLVEEFISGQEVDVDVVVENGVVKFCAISDNFEVTPPYFCEQGGLIPSALGPKEQAAIRTLLDNFIASHGANLHGVLHYEAKYDFEREKAFVIEVNVRPGSAETHTMVETVYGVHLGECLVKLALGESLDDLRLEEVKPEGYAASVNVYPSGEGMLRKIKLRNDQDEALVRFSSLPEGSNVAPPPISFGLMAWMVASGKDAKEARSNIDRLTASLEVELGRPCGCDENGKFEVDAVENSSFALSMPASRNQSFATLSFAGLGTLETIVRAQRRIRGVIVRIGCGGPCICGDEVPAKYCPCTTLADGGLIRSNSTELSANERVFPFKLSSIKVNKRYPDRVPKVRDRCEFKVSSGVPHKATSIRIAIPHAEEKPQQQQQQPPTGTATGGGGSAKVVASPYSADKAAGGEGSSGNTTTTTNTTTSSLPVSVSRIQVVAVEGQQQDHHHHYLQEGFSGSNVGSTIIGDSLLSEAAVGQDFYS